MKTKRKVIDADNLPIRLPITKTAVIYLLLDHIDAHEWLWGALGVIVIAMWATAIYFIRTQKRVNIFENENRRHIDNSEGD